MTDRDPHVSEHELVLAFYGETNEETAASIDAHLAVCSLCRTEQAALARTLQLVSTARAPEPSPDFEARAWARLEPQLRHRGWRGRALTGIVVWAAAVTLVVAGTLTWVKRNGPMVPDDTPRSVEAVDVDDSVQERVLLTAVDAHLSQAEVLFVELLNAPPDEPQSLDYARYAADDLVSSGRLYRETARATGDAPVAAVLDDLEAVLVELARSPDQPRAQDIEALQGRIEADDLIFKVRAVSLDIRDRQSRMNTGEGAL
jgi:hypothetical protein